MSADQNQLDSVSSFERFQSDRDTSHPCSSRLTYVYSSIHYVFDIRLSYTYTSSDLVPWDWSPLPTMPTHTQVRKLFGAISGQEFSSHNSLATTIMSQVPMKHSTNGDCHSLRFYGVFFDWWIKILWSFQQDMWARYVVLCIYVVGV